MAPQTPKSLKEQIASLKGGGQTVTPPALENLKKEKTDKKKPNRGNKENWGGARDGAGREAGGTSQQKRLRKILLEKHFGEEVTVKMKDPKSGKEVTVKKPRVVLLMERLYMIGMGMVQGDPAAIDKWLNRALGKAPQPLIGDEEEDPVKIDLGVERILGKAYGDEDEE